jgi:hypothetical protein
MEHLGERRPGQPRLGRRRRAELPGQLPQRGRSGLERWLPRGSSPAAEIRAIGVGVSGSDLFLFNEGPVQRLQKVLYGDVPLQHQINVQRLDEVATWPTGVSNPWGFDGGTRLQRYEHAAWYYATQGSLDNYDKPTLDSLMMRDNPAYRGQWSEAYEQFGPNGSRVSQWGQIPNYPPAD